MTTKMIDVQEAQTHFPQVLSSLETGMEIILTRDNTPIARMTPLPAASTARVPGLHAGAIKLAADFDEPLPDAFWMGVE